MTGLSRQPHRIAGALHQAAPVIRQGQVLLAFSVRDVEGVRCERNGDDEDLDNAIGILLTA